MSVRNIEYHLSRFGAIKIPFYEASSRVVEMLEHHGFIEKMKKNPQLGAIQRAYEGSHHTRWEYVMVQLYLLEELRNHGRFSGLNSPRKYLNSSLTSYEVIQIWILLLNAFHLYGTFANERAFLIYLKTNKVARDAFKRGLPKSANVADFFVDVFGGDKTYLVHELIAFFMLKRMSLKWKDVSLLALEILEQYRHPKPKTHVASDRLYFKKIRQISFLYLDSQYSSSPITLDINHLLSNKDAFVGLVNENGVMTTAIDYFQRTLCKAFYLSPRSLVSLRIQQEKALGELRVNAPETILQLRDLIFGKDKALGLHKESVDRAAIHFFIEEHRSPHCIRKVLSIEDEVAFNRKFSPLGATCLLKKDPSQTILALNIDVSLASTLRKKSSIASSVVHMLYDLKNQKGMTDEMISDGLREVVMFILKSCNEDFKYEFKGSHDVDSYWTVAGGSIKSAKAIDSIISKFVACGVCKDKIHELESLKKAILKVKFKGLHVITSDSVIIKDDNNHIMDIDGFCMLASSVQPGFIHVQAKNKPRSVMSKSKKQICDVNMKLNLCKGTVCDLLNPCSFPLHRAVFAKILL